MGEIPNYGPEKLVAVNQTYNKQKDIIMRFSTLITKAVKKASKGKNNEENISKIVEVVERSITAYRGTSKGVLAANKDVRVCTVRGEQSLRKLDEESLLIIIKAAHGNCIGSVDDENENFELNAELSRALATDPVLLGATYWLANPDTEATKLL